MWIHIVLSPLSCCLPISMETHPHTRLVLKDVPSAVCFSPDSKTIAVADGQGCISLWETKSGQLRCLIQPSLQGSKFERKVFVSDLAFAPDGRSLILVCSPYSTLNGARSELQVWHLPSRSCRLALRADDHRHRRIAVSPDGTCVASGTSDGKVELWDLVRGRSLGFIASPPSTKQPAFAFSLKGSFLAVATSTGIQRSEIVLWDMRKPRPEEAQKLAVPLPVSMLSFSPDDEKLFLVCDEELRELLLCGKKTIRVCLPPLDSASFSPTARRVAVKHRESDPVAAMNMITLRDTSTWSQVAIVRIHYASRVRLSPCGSFLATVTWGAEMSPYITLWRIRSQTRKGDCAK
jgi:WD40 repeat protein